MLNSFKKGIVGVVGGAVAYTTSNFATGRITWGEGHSYKKVYCLGKESDCGTPKEYMEKLYKQPNGLFPMTRVTGKFDGEGSQLYLQFANETPNPVEVVNQTETSVRLKTGKGHKFKGTAEHSVTEKGGYIYYSIDGIGVKNESFADQTACVLFADVGWWLNMPQPVERKEALENVIKLFEENNV